MPFTTLAPRNRLRKALTACDPQVRARLQGAFHRLRPELKRLFQCHGNRPQEAGELLEKVVLSVLIARAAL